MEYRTKATIQEGITAQWELGDGRVSGVVIDYQPGNGTRYVLSFQHITDPGCAQHLGVSGGGCVVGWVDHLTIVVPTYRGAFLDWSYVAEKLKVNKADAVVLAEVIGYIAGVRSTTSESARIEDGGPESPTATSAPS